MNFKRFFGTNKKSEKMSITEHNCGNCSFSEECKECKESMKKGIEQNPEHMLQEQFCFLHSHWEKTYLGN